MNKEKNAQVQPKYTKSRVKPQTLVKIGLSTHTGTRAGCSNQSKSERDSEFVDRLTGGGW